MLTIAGCAGPSTPPSEPLQAAPTRVWSTAALADLREIARAAPSHGLPEETETLASFDALEPRAGVEAPAAAEIDRLADALFERLALALATGAVDPRVDPDWRFPRPSPPDVAALRADVQDGASAASLLAALAPRSLEYATLKTELGRLLHAPPTELDTSGLSREARIDHLRASLERLRWLPRDRPARRLDVYVPFFELAFREGDATPVIHPVIVGARRTPTPSFGAMIESITFNPTWTPPPSIALGELLPRFRRDPGAVEREGFDILDRDGANVELSVVDWAARPFPYSFRQRPGPGNALGQVRFDLPNSFAIYLHDTPSRALFARAERALSHGCIRVAEPRALAAELLSGEELDGEGIDALIAPGVTQTTHLAAPVPIYVLYITALPDGLGGVRYAQDLYRRDERLLRALSEGSLLSAAPFNQASCATD